jgi:hypothetical protein
VRVNNVTVKTLDLTRSFPGITMGPVNGVIYFNSRGMRQTSSSTGTLYAVKSTDTATVQVTGIGRVYRAY